MKQSEDDALRNTDRPLQRPRTIRNVRQLAAVGAIASACEGELERVTDVFSMSVTTDLLDLIDTSDPNDPIARQYLPSLKELHITSEERGDPIGDDPHERVKGLIHRYPDRVLLKLISVCPVYCRFCFRREKVGPGNDILSPIEVDAALEYIRSNPAIWEVILTGGDPLMLSERRLGDVVERLNAIDHVDIVRVHTRVPVADPARITPGVVAALRRGKPAWVVIHCNHARELTAAARAACALMVDAGIPLLSQSVLLRGVNDDVATLTELMRSLVRSRVKPYHLYHGDLAKGTSHFRCTIEEGQQLVRSLRGAVSGLCQPTFLLDIPGGYGKVPIGPSYVAKTNPDDERWHVSDPWGGHHVYPPLGS